MFEGLRDLLTEFLQYHRDDKGKINKKMDDILDAMRYAYMMRRFAIRYGDIGPPKVVQVQAIPMSNSFNKR